MSLADLICSMFFLDRSQCMFFLSLVFFIRCLTREITTVQCGRILLSSFRGVKSVKPAMKPAWRSWKNLISLALGEEYESLEALNVVSVAFPWLTWRFLGKMLNSKQNWTAATVFFGHLRVVEQADNTINYDDIIPLCVLLCVKILPTYTSSRHRASLVFICVSGNLMNITLTYPFLLDLFWFLPTLLVIGQWSWCLQGWWKQRAKKGYRVSVEEQQRTASLHYTAI